MRASIPSARCFGRVTDSSVSEARSLRYDVKIELSIPMLGGKKVQLPTRDITVNEFFPQESLKVTSPSL